MDTIEDWIRELQQTQKLIIVEGKKDLKAFASFGITKAIEISGPFYKLIESIEDKDVIILTDLDSEGRKLYSKIKHHLQKRGVRIDNHFREFLFTTQITTIESLSKIEIN